jgi:leucyl-tRNA synthetase
MKYQPQEFEKKWIEEWEKAGVYKVHKVIKSIKSENKKQYVLAMFPYPSGAGLHVGHVRNYTGTDVLARYMRMSGYSVLQPMGWDAFGLPAENAAVKAKKNPMDMVPTHIATFKKQMMSLGFGNDWSREFSTTDPNYYKWTQWLFIQFYKMGLLYKKNAPINYCPKCKTGLAEEEVLADGTHERCGNKIEKRDLPQWVFRITKYADRLLSDLEGLDWPKGILEMQRNWIGKKEGINIDYKIIDPEARPQMGPRRLSQKQVSSLPTIGTITCFTTRPDTNFGATFIVLAPEHEFVKKINNEDVKKYVKEAASKSEQERLNENKKKTGVFTGFYAVNNLNGKLLPIWISDFVLSGFGTGAVVGVPAHDLRDYDFAKEFGIEIIRVVVGKDGDKSEITKREQVQEEEGTMINSEFLDGLDIHVATKKIMDYLEEKGWGKRVVTYHLRDWIFSRQRYWGEPIPMINCEKCGWNPIPESELPLKLPYIKSYEPTETGESPLSVIPEFVNTTCPKCGGKAKRETDTMPNWAGSCWYFLAFSFWNQEKAITNNQNPRNKQIKNLNNQNSKQFENSNLDVGNCLNTWNLDFGTSIKQWLPVDWYLGGAEHAVLHLLYSRFWVKALYDLKLLDFKEPFLRLRNQGMILAEDHRKMSKSFGNVINPDDVIKEFGADALRIYEMFMAPFNQEISWATKSLHGSYRFVKRVWDLFQQYSVKSVKSVESVESVKINSINLTEDKNLVAKLQKTIRKVTSDISEVKFNTAIAAMMGFINEWEKALGARGYGLAGENAKKFLQILAPFAPFMTEEIWRNVFGEKESIHLSAWPKIESEIIEEEIILPIQINGKLRDTLSVRNHELGEKEKIIEQALKSEKIKKYIIGKPKKIIYVPGKIINFIV